MTTYEVIVRFLNADTDRLEHDYITVVAVSEEVALVIAQDVFINNPEVNYEYYELIVAREVGE